MDPRFERIFTEQQSLGFPGLSGSTVNATIRIGEALLNTGITAALPADGVVRALTVRPREDNRLEARVTLARPAFLPPFTVELAIERQPVLPADPALVLRLAGGAGSLLRLASSFVRRSVPLSAGITIDGDRVRIDIRAVLRDHGQAALLDLAREISVTTEPAGLVVAVHAVIS